MEHLTHFTADHSRVETPPPAIIMPALPTPGSPPILTAPIPYLRTFFTEKFTSGVALATQSLCLAINAFMFKRTARPIDLYADPYSVDKERVTRLLEEERDRNGNNDSDDTTVDLDLLMRCYKQLARIEIIEKEREKEEEGRGEEEGGGGGEKEEGGKEGGEGGEKKEKGGGEGEAVGESSLSAEDTSVKEVEKKDKRGRGGRGGGAAGGAGNLKKRKRRNDSSARPRIRNKVLSSP